MRRSLRMTWLTLSASVLTMGVALAQATVAPPIQPDAKTKEVLQARQDLLAKLSPVTDEMLLNPPASEWLQWRRTYDAQGFSPLSQINKTNVANLRPAWTWTLPAGTSEIAPLVHDGIMFVQGNGDRVQALDAATGDLLWDYTRPAVAGARTGGGGQIKRNFAIYGDTVVIATGDGKLAALDAKTGKLVWEAPVTAEPDKYQMTSGPLAVKGKLVQGMSQCSGTEPGGCFIMALDAKDGKQVWRFNTLARPGEKNGDTWNNLPLERRNGGSVWSTGSYDPKTNLLYWGVGNTYNWQDLTRGKLGTTDKSISGLYINSTLALNPDSGKLKWHYQHLPAEPWDLDFAFERQVADISFNGKPRHVVMTTGKIVVTDVLDANTGKWLFSKDQGIQNVVKSIDPKTGQKIYNPEAVPDMTFQRRNLQCPAGYGAKNYPANSYNASTKMLYITIAEVCGESVPKNIEAGKYTGGGQETRIARYIPGSDGNIGRIDAINLETQKTVWSTRQRASMTGAALATAGGLVFTGDSDRWVKAYDDATGQVLWQMRLNDAITSFPISYSVSGKQYIAIPAGFGGARIGNLRQLTTEINTPRGGGATMWVFEVPGAR